MFSAESIINNNLNLQGNKESRFVSININYIEKQKGIIIYYDEEKTKIKSIYRFNLNGKLNGKIQSIMIHAAAKENTERSENQTIFLSEEKYIGIN